MKKVMTMMLGLALLTGAVGLAFAQQDQPKAEKSGKKGKTDKRKAEEPKQQKKKK